MWLGKKYNTKFYLKLFWLFCAFYKTPHSFIIYYDFLQISDLEQDKRDLERQVNELKAKCEQIEKRAAEQRQVEEKKHTEEIQFLKRTNQQLKVESKIISMWSWHSEKLQIH